MSNSGELRNRRILIIDDNESIHRDFRKILGDPDPGNHALAAAEAKLFGEEPLLHGKRGYELRSCFQGQEGLDTVREAVQSGQPFAMAFVDVRMPPGWDGVETTTRLWEADPDLQIVICTAYADYSWDEMIARLGDSDRLVILKKPFDAIEVLQLANSLTEKWHLLQRSRARLQDLETVVNQRTAALQKEVAEHLLTERALRTTQDKLKHFLAKSPAVLYSLRFESGNWLPAWVSDNFTDLTGFETVEWYRQAPDLQCVEESGRTAIRESLAKLPAQDQFSLEYRLHRRDGMVRWIRDDRQVLRAEANQAIEIVGCWTDVTEQRLLEDELRQSQKMESVGLLAGGIAHDFNNLLTVIRCHVDMLLHSGEFSGEANESLRGILASSERAGNLTRQLLAFSRKQVMRTEELDFNELVRGLTRLFGRTLGEQIHLETRFGPDVPGVLADPGMLEQVIMNLALNSRDAMPTGGKLTLATSLREFDEAHLQQHPGARRGRFVCLTVTDTGCGIASEHLPHIFEPFFTTKAVGRGTGLGLATVYGILKQHDGWVEVTSQTGCGTTFEVFLPALAAVAASTVTKLPVPESRGGSETILLVEDEPALRVLVQKTLQRNGYHVFTASSGAQALENWASRIAEVDLLLTDMVMPDGVSGWELAQKLLAQKPGLKTIFMSGYSAELTQDNPVLGREVFFLAKPFPPQALALTVRACLDGRKQPGSQAPGKVA